MKSDISPTLKTRMSTSFTLGSRWLLFASLAFAPFLFTATGCRLKSPTLAEQQVLTSRSIMNPRSASWAAAPLARGNIDAAASGIPDYTQGTPPIDLLSSQAMPVQPLSQVATVQQTTMAPSPSSTSQTAVGTTSDRRENQSPLERIAQSCPGSEKQVNEALSTAELKSRLAMYQALTERCPASADLWDWLGQDYLKAGKIEEAKRAFGNAIQLDPLNMEAKGHLAEAQKRSLQ